MRLRAQYLAHDGVPVDPQREVTVCCGSTEAMLAAILAAIDPGDEVIVFEPFYENYGPGAIMAGATPVYVTLSPPNWRIDPDRLRAAFTNRTRAIVINTPTNPTGKVFTREELGLIAELCQHWDVLAIADQIYEHIVFDGSEHVGIRSLPGMAERTVTISGLSKTYSVTGWRIGWAIAPGGADARHPQDARFPDDCGALAAAGSGCGRARAAGLVLPRHDGAVSAAA